MSGVFVSVGSMMPFDRLTRAGHEGAVEADFAFHLAIARATRNTAIYNAIEHLWDLRSASPEPSRSVAR